ncbi:MAG TPA: 30S ribosomal protein S9, partial [Balneolales bacterium]|nr:30S ribosomal protein S9 [Balneolales bacterium]
DIKVTVAGGGQSGQAEAIQMGVARGLDALNEDLHSTLKSNRLLTRDDRMVERKKYGQPKARKRFQFSKR